MQAIKTNCNFDLQQTIGIVQIIQKLLSFLSFVKNYYSYVNNRKRPKLSNAISHVLWITWNINYVPILGNDMNFP